MNLAEIRQQYPQYDGLPDGDLAGRLHRRFYPDMPRAEFDQRIGLSPDAERSREERAATIAHARPSAPEAPPEQIGLNLTSGLNEIAYGIAGYPGNVVRNLRNWGTALGNTIAGRPATEGFAPDDSFGTSEWLAQQFERIGVVNPADVPANTLPEKIARGAGVGVAATLLPEAAAPALGRLLAPRAAEVAGSLLGRGESAAAMAGNAAVGGAAGAGAAAGAGLAPEGYEGLGALAGGLGAGGIAALASGLPSVVRETGRIAGDYAAPLTTAGRERLAGRAIEEAASDPTALRRALETPEAPIVAGSRPTTFQQTGDMGLGALERRVQTQFPEQFMTRRGEQNAARLSAMESIQPAGNPEAITTALRTRLREIDDLTAQATERATQFAAERARAVGGGGSSANYGERLRDFLRTAEDTARAEERRLWAAVDPDGRLGVVTDPIRMRAAQIMRELEPTARPMEGEEAAIFRVASELAGQQRFNNVAALRSRLSTAMRQEMMTNGRSPVYARLSRLRGAVEETLDGTIRQVVREEAEAVARGEMRAEDTIVSRLDAGLEADRDRWLADRGRGISARSVEGTGTSGATRARSLPRGDRAKGESGGGPDAPEGDQGLPPAADFQPFDAAARSRLSAANTATRQRAETFGSQTVKPILRREGQSGPYNLMASAVPERVFYAGPKSAESIAQFRRAVGDERALQVLEDYAATRVRSAAEGADGTIDPKKLDGWRRAHADALRSFPALDRRLGSAAAASESLASVGAIRRQALDDYQKGLVGQLLGASDPGDVVRMVGSIFGRRDSVQQMRRLIAEMRGNPEALNGLRKSIADYITGRFVSNAEAATTGQGALKSDQIQSFVRQNEAALRLALGDEGLDTLKAVAADLQRASRSQNAVRIPGQSNTAQDLTAVGPQDNAQTVLAKLVLSSAPSGAAGYVILGPITGLAATLGTAAVLALRQAGLRRVDELVRDAMLDPALARILLAKAETQTGKRAGSMIAQRYRNVVIPTLFQMRPGDDRPAS